MKLQNLFIILQRERKNLLIEFKTSVHFIKQKKQQQNILNIYVQKGCHKGSFLVSPQNTILLWL